MQKLKFDEYDHQTQYELFKDVNNLIKGVPLNNSMLDILILMITDRSQFIRGIAVCLLEQIVVKDCIADSLAIYMMGYLINLLQDDYRSVREGALNVIDNMFNNKKMSRHVKKEYIDRLKAIVIEPGQPAREAILYLIYNFGDNI